MLVAALAVVLASALVRLGRVRELHHGYYGFLLALLPWHIPHVLGVVLLADDAMQHAVQVWRPAFESPLHRLYDIAYRLPAIRRLNEWLDRELA